MLRNGLLPVTDPTGNIAPVTTRQELYDLVWSKPMTTVAAQFGVSGSYMARVCAVLRVPRPQRGYWAKLAVGKAPSKPPLPEAQPGDQIVWSKDGALQEPDLGPVLGPFLARRCGFFALDF